MLFLHNITPAVGDALLLHPCYISAYIKNQINLVSYYVNMIQKNYCNE